MSAARDRVRASQFAPGVKAQPSPGLSGRQSPSAGKAKRPHNAALGSRSCPREDPVAHNYNGHGADSFEPSSLHTATLLRIPRGPAPLRVRPRPCVWATTANEVLANSAAFVRDLWPSTGAVSYTHLRAHETVLDLVCRLLLEKK